MQKESIILIMIEMNLREKNVVCRIGVEIIIRKQRVLQVVPIHQQAMLAIPYYTRVLIGFVGQTSMSME